MYRTGQKTMAAGEVFGVFDCLGIGTEGDWEVQLHALAGQLVLVDDMAGTANGLPVGGASGLPITRMMVRNEEVYVKNRSTSSGSIALLIFQV